MRMTALVTGSSGHLGEALVRTLRAMGREVIGLDIAPGPFTSQIGSITDRACVQRVIAGIQTVFHTAALHKPHVATHDRAAFVETNVGGTLALLEEAVTAGAGAFVLTSTTSAFGDALAPPAAMPAAWVTEDVRPIPRNIHGVTKAAAEDLCQLSHRNQGLAGVVLRTSRFFAEEDDDGAVRGAYPPDNAKVNEYLFRRVELQDAVRAHPLAAEHAPALGFRRYVVSATTPFTRGDLTDLRRDAPPMARRRTPKHELEYARRGWAMLPGIDRVHVNRRCRARLAATVRFPHHVVGRLRAGEDRASPLARQVGSKGYHGERFAERPYPVD